jgi:hypothetical protein
MSSEPKVAAPIDAMSISEFCRRHSLSEPMYYKLQKHGRGPRVMRLGGRTLITADSAARWRRAVERRSAATTHIWCASVPIGGTIAEHYLVRVRGIDIARIPELEDVLRFHPSCPFGDGSAPSVIALVRDVVTDAPRALHIRRRR